VVDVQALHRAADRIWEERYSEDMNALARAIGDFIATSELATVGRDGTAEPWTVEPQSLGYGVMVGFLAARE
jgi:hypothetical protein